MSENSFYEALFRIMWDMEVDVFTQPKRTLALVSDIVPKCRKQKNRLKAMYDCGAMEKIEQAVADRIQGSAPSQFSIDKDSKNIIFGDNKYLNHNVD